MNMNANRKLAADRFAKVIEYGKGALLLVLLVGALVNGHKEYISENPRKFVWDSFASGGFAALAFFIIARMRGRADLAIQVALFSFLLFFFYNVVRELSGFNALADEKKHTQGEAQQVKYLKWPSIIITLLGVIVLVYLAYKARVPHPFYLLIGEAVLFGVMSGLAELVIAKNHHETPMGLMIASLGSTVMFFIVHLILQWGGLYSHIFGDGMTPPNIY